MSVEKPSRDPSLHGDDEIDLLQLWLIITKRKYVVLCFLVVCLIAGSLFVFLKPMTYKYTTIIEIGSVKNKQLEPPQSLLAKIKEVYIPQVLSEGGAKDGRLVRISASATKRSPYVTLTSKGALEDFEAVVLIHNSVVGSVLDEQRHLIDGSRNEYLQSLAIKLESAKSQLNEILDRGKLILSRGKRLEETRVFLTRQIEETEVALALAYSLRSKLQSSRGGTDTLVALVLVDNQIAQNKRELALMQERLEVTLADDTQGLELQLAGNMRKQALQKGKIDRLQEYLTGFTAPRDIESGAYSGANTMFQETRTLGVAVRSSQPTGPGKAVLLGLSAVIGIMGGAMLAFFVEFVSNARRRLQQETGHA